MLGTCRVTTLEEDVMHWEVGHGALGALEPPCTYVEEECLSRGAIVGGHTIFLRGVLDIWTPRFGGHTTLGVVQTLLCHVAFMLNVALHLGLCC